MLESVLAVATILGGIAALLYFRDKLEIWYDSRRQRRNALEVVDETVEPRRPIADTSADQTAAPVAFLFGSSLEEIRQLSYVRPLNNSENELNLYALPNGVYGYVQSPRLQPPKYWTLDSRDFVVAPSDTELHTRENPSGDVEVHKSRDGTVYIAAYVVDSERITSQNQNRDDPIRVTIAFRPYEEFQTVVAIPRDRLTGWSPRRHADGEPVADVWIS